MPTQLFIFFREWHEIFWYLGNKWPFLENKLYVRLSPSISSFGRLSCFSGRVNIFQTMLVVYVHDYLNDCCVADSSTTPSSSSLSLSCVRVSYGELYATLCRTLSTQQTTLLLYMLLHRVDAVRAFILSRANIDHLVCIVDTCRRHLDERGVHSGRCGWVNA